MEDEKKVEEKKEKPIDLFPVIERKPEFSDVLKTYMGRTGQSKDQAVAFLGGLMDRLNIDPERDLNEAVRMAGQISSILQMFPDTPLTSAAKSAAAEVGLGKALERATAKPDPSEKATKIMEAMAPYMLMAPVLREMARTMGGGGGGDSDPKLAAVEAKLASVEEKLKEKPIEELKAVVQGLRDEIKELKAGGLKPKEEGEGVLAKKLDELKTALTGTKESGVEKKLDELTKALTEKDRAKELSEFKQAMESVKTDVASKLASLESSMAEGKPQQDIMKQAGDLFNGIGNLYKGFGEAARSMGYEPKDEKLSGDIKRDIVSLGKKALDVVEKGFKYPREKPERHLVQQLPTVEIPITEPHPQSQPKEGVKTNIELRHPAGVGDIGSVTEIPEQPSVAPFAKKPKPAEAPAETPTPEQPPEAPPEKPAEEKPKEG